MRVAIILLGLVLVFGFNLDAQAQPILSTQGTAGVAVSLAEPPLHRGSRHHRSSAPIHRGGRRGNVSPQARMADWYARTAVSQSHTAWSFGCAYAHPRWSTSYQEHYQWAYRQPFHHAQREIERRERTLARCLAW